MGIVKAIVYIVLFLIAVPVFMFLRDWAMDAYTPSWFDWLMITAVYATWAMCWEIRERLKRIEMALRRPPSGY